MASLYICLAFVGLNMVMAQRGEGPQMAQNFYDRILNNPGSERFGQNLTFIKETLHDDWNLRPNPFGETFGTGVASGPFPEGFQKFMGLWSVMIPDIYWKRQHTLLCSNDKFNGAPHVFLSKFDATMNEVPEGFDEFPMFPGIDPEKIKGKHFETLAIDIHIIKNGKTKRTWHFEDWASAVPQLLRDEPAPTFRNPSITPGEYLIEVPQSIDNFYAKILSDVNGGGQDDNLISQTVHKDWNVRANPLNPVYGNGPNAEGLKQIGQSFGAVFSNLKFDRQHTFLCGDRLAVLSKVSATINQPPPGFDEFPMFPGIEPEKLKGKYFETLALDIQVVSEGKIKQSWHIEDWSTALDQALYGKPIPDFGLDDAYITY